MIRSVVSAIGGAAIAAGSVFLVMAAREAAVVRGAVNAARIEEQSACNDRVAQVGRAIDVEVDRRVQAALDAANALEETPDVPADLQALCDRSASCLDRKRP